MKFRPLHDRVVVKRIEADEKTAGGIIIPDTAKEKPQQGEVIAVGPGGRDESGKLIPIDVQAGDRVFRQVVGYRGEDRRPISWECSSRRKVTGRPPNAVASFQRNLGARLDCFRRLHRCETTRRADRVISSARCAVDLLQQNPKPTRAQIDAQHKWYDRSQSAP